MKKVRIILAAFLVFGLSSFAGEAEVMKKKMNIKDQIFEKVDVSNHQSSGTVHVTFEITENNNLLIHHISTTNAELESYVRKCLSDTYIDASEQTKGRIFEIELNFFLL